MRAPRAPRSLVTVAALAALLALAGCGDDEPRPAAEPSNEVSSSQSTSQSRSKPTEEATKEAVAGATLDITVAGDDVSPMGQTVDMAVGDVLTVRITSDRAGELHVHSSPEQTVGFGKGSSTRQVKIDKPGQVDVEEHESGALVARLLVK